MNLNLFMKNFCIKIHFLKFTHFEKQNHYYNFYFDRAKIQLCWNINYNFRIYVNEKENSFMETRIFRRYFVLKKLNNIVKFTFEELKTL